MLWYTYHHLFKWCLLAPTRRQAIIWTNAGILLIVIVNLTLRSNLQWNVNRNSYIFIQENAFENVVCDISAIFFPRPQYVKNIMTISRHDKLCKVLFFTKSSQLCKNRICDMIIQYQLFQVQCYNIVADKWFSGTSARELCNCCGSIITIFSARASRFAYCSSGDYWCNSKQYVNCR